MRKALFPISFLLGAVTAIRNRLYDQKWLKIVELPCPVVSVGNLTVGGTGKTPLVHWIAGELQQLGKKPLILSRGYGGSYDGVQRVDIRRRNAEVFFGDEPVLLSQKRPEVPVYVTRKRSTEARHIFEIEKPDVIILDDGFQHRGLARTLDIVAIDTTKDEFDLRLLPVGRAREPWAALKRAQFVVLAKSNLAKPENLRRLRALIPSGQTVVEMDYKIKCIRNFGERVSNETPVASTWLAFSAIGNPESFGLLLKSEGLSVKEHMIYRDHYTYSEADLATIIKKAIQRGAANVITTEKDAVKIGKWPATNVGLWVVELETKMGEGKEKLHEALRRITH